MSKTSTFTKVLTMLLAVIMVISLLPVPQAEAAAEIMNPGIVDNNYLRLSKVLTYDEATDSYTITMTVYAKGHVDETTESAITQYSISELYSKQADQSLDISDLAFSVNGVQYTLVNIEKDKNNYYVKARNSSGEEGWIKKQLTGGFTNGKGAAKLKAEDRFEAGTATILVPVSNYKHNAAVMKDFINLTNFDVSSAAANVQLQRIDNGAVVDVAATDPTIDPMTGLVTATGLVFDQYFQCVGFDYSKAYQYVITITGLQLKSDAKGQIKSNMETNDGVYSAANASADYTVNSPFFEKYRVRFVNDDGTLLQQTQHDLGDMPAYNGTPTKESSGDTSYTFAGWDRPIVPVAYENDSYIITYTATYSESVSKTVPIDFSSWIKIADNVQSIQSGENGQNGKFKVDTDGTLYYRFNDVELPSDTNSNAANFSAFETKQDTVTVTLKTGGTATYTAVPASAIYYDDNIDGQYLDSNGASGVEKGSDQPNVATVELNSGTYTITFTGTGIDVYCTTTSDSGYVQGALYKGDTRVALVTMKNQSTEARYNTPTLSFTGYQYDTYTLKINVLSSSKYQFDGIRIYGSINDQTKYDNTNEQYAVYANLRAALINSTTAPVDITTSLDGTGNNPTGVLFLDSIKPLTMTKTTEDGTTEAVYKTQIAAYKALGPKNEIYLDYTHSETVEGSESVQHTAQSIAFTLANAPTTGEHYYIGLSAPETGSGTVEVNQHEVTITSEVDLYYDITAYVLGEKVVTIENTGESLISVTNLKITGNESLYTTYKNSLKSAQTSGTNAAPASFSKTLFAPVMKTVRTLAAAPVAEPEVTPEVTPEPALPVEPVDPSGPVEPTAPIESTEPTTEPTTPAETPAPTVEPTAPVETPAPTPAADPATAAKDFAKALKKAAKAAAKTMKFFGSILSKLFF